MQVEVNDREVVIRLPRINEASKSGKSLLLATSGGNKETSTVVEGKKVVVGLNVYIPR
jgi:hypothetical protein